MPIVPKYPSDISNAKDTAPAAGQPRRKSEPAQTIERTAQRNCAMGVGYKNPPKHTQFKPGQSGNPKGRPKGAKGVKTIVREILCTVAEVKTSAGVVKMSKFEAVIHKVVELAMKGNFRALMQLISLYTHAVPDEDVAGVATPAGELTATDEAILEEFKALILRSEKD